MKVEWEIAARGVHRLVLFDREYYQTRNGLVYVAHIRRNGKRKPVDQRRLIVHISAPYTPDKRTEVMVLKGSMSWVKARQIVMVTLRLYGHDFTTR